MKDKFLCNGYRELFHKQFKDPYDFTDKVISCCDKIFEIYDGDLLISAMCVFNVSIENHCGGYIYGAVTREEYRGRGYFKKLIQNAKSFYLSKGYDFLFTIPAEKSLFYMYERLGFDTPLGGILSLFGNDGKIIPDNVCFKDFDDNFDFLYSLHKKYDALIKEKNFFRLCLSDFTIKYADDGYAVFDNDKLIYLVCGKSKYEKTKKGLLMFLNKFDLPENILCDMLLEI